MRDDREEEGAPGDERVGSLVRRGEGVDDAVLVCLEHEAEERSLGRERGSVGRGRGEDLLAERKDEREELGREVHEGGAVLVLCGVAHRVEDFHRRPQPCLDLSLVTGEHDLYLVDEAGPLLGEVALDDPAQGLADLLLDLGAVRVGCESGIERDEVALDALAIRWRDLDKGGSLLGGSDGGRARVDAGLEGLTPARLDAVLEVDGGGEADDGGRGGRGRDKLEERRKEALDRLELSGGGGGEGQL